MHLGHTILRYHQVASTNDIAWQHAGDDKNHGLVVIADEQSAGRGRRGDQWHAPSGSALLLSMLLHPPPFCRRPVILTLWAALGVCQLVEQIIGQCPLLKWPNDVLIETQKVCGILVEQRQEWFVVGVGLNVKMPAGWFSSTRLANAASLNDFTSKPLDLELLFQKLLSIWNDDFQQLAGDKRSDLVALWQRYSQLVGQQVTLKAAGIIRQGKLVSLDWDCMTIETNGMQHAFVPESISKLLKA